MDGGRRASPGDRPAAGRWHRSCCLNWSRPSAIRRRWLRSQRW